ncbi:MAG TPA: glycosyltransferase, partial [Burkholderiales bacterium]|nr:glycosyltransferase [Burkholderiales bacterium]
MRSDPLPRAGERGRAAESSQLEPRPLRLAPRPDEGVMPRGVVTAAGRTPATTRDPTPPQQLESAASRAREDEPRTRRRILHVVPGLGHGGAEHQLLMNIEKLDGTRFESHVAYLYPRTQLAPSIEAAGARVHSAVCPGPFGTARRIVKLARLIRRLDVDLVHTSNVDGELHGGIAGRITGVPVVATLTNIANEEVRLVDNPHLSDRKLKWAQRLRR